MSWEDFPLVTVAHALLAVPVSIHVLLRKHERAAVAWIGLIWLAPFVGALLYYLFGINRIQRKASKLRRRGGTGLPRLDVEHSLPAGLSPAVSELVRLGQSVHPQPFLPGNRVEPLVNGGEAYPAMLEAIASARESVAFSVYIFDPGEAGLRFVEAFAAASRRGVQVRILLDGIGSSRFPSEFEEKLESRGVQIARFLPRRLGSLLRFVNLRSHRKILLVDGDVAFVGGMNIREGYLNARQPHRPIQDLHFRVRGPLLDQIAAVFEEDWEFCGGASVRLPRWSGSGAGPSDARIIADGPDVAFEKLQWILVGALSSAERRVCIITPYFLPNEIVTHALQLAALRGVSVEVLVPAVSDLAFIGWAMQAGFERLLSHGVRIFRSPPPFDHSKLFLVDEGWALAGSSNWDARSLRLNFEIDMEVIDPELSRKLGAIFDGKKGAASEVSFEETRRWPLVRKLRNNVVRLFSPYL